MQIKALKFALTITLAGSLAACGGGGDDSPTASAEGIWGGTTSGGATTALIVLPNGDTWGVYGNDASASAGILQGHVSTLGDQVSGTVLDFNLTGAGQANVSISGTVSTRSSMDLLLGGTVSLPMTYDASYDTPASLASMAGTYTGAAMGLGGYDDSAQVVISGNTITTGSTNAPGCTGSGTVSLRTEGKAIVDFSVTFSGTACLVPDGTVIQGVAQYYPDTQEITAIGLNAARSQGVIMLASRATPS